MNSNAKAILEVLQFVNQITDEGSTVNQPLVQLLKENNCKNSGRLSKYLIKKRYVEVQRIHKKGVAYKWICQSRPNIKMVELIIEGVKTMGRTERRRYKKSNTKKLLPDVILDRKVDQQCNSVKIIQQLESDILVIEKILQEKVTALKVLKTMIK